MFGGSCRAGRRGRGPFLLECLTHRRRGHYEGDAQEYRDEFAEREWEQRDPLVRFQRVCLERRGLSAGGRADRGDGRRLRSSGGGVRSREPDAVDGARTVTGVRLVTRELQFRARRD